MTPFELVDTICLVTVVGFIAGELGSIWAQRVTAPVHNQPVHNLVETQPAPAPQPALSEDDFRTIQGWASLNPWYAADMALNNEAQAVHMALRSLHPELALIDNLAAVTMEMHRRHPEIVPTKQ
jgi:hypothetical protein